MSEKGQIQTAGSLNHNRVVKRSSVVRASYFNVSIAYVKPDQLAENMANQWIILSSYFLYFLLGVKDK